MTECTKVIKPKLERTGLNSLRDFFIDNWVGTNVANDKDAEAFLKNFVEENNPDKIISRLDRGKIFLFFITNSQYRYRIKNQPPSDAGYEFRITPVDQDVALVYVRAKRGNMDNLKLVSAELNGHSRVLRKAGFEREYFKRWMNCRIADKITCIDEVKMILSKPEWTEAFIHYNPYFTSNEYILWAKKYGIDIQIRKGFRVLLSDIIKHIKK